MNYDNETDNTFNIKAGDNAQYTSQEMSPSAYNTQYTSQEMSSSAYNAEYTSQGSTSSARERLQEKRNEVSKSMLLVMVGVLLLFIPPVGIAVIIIAFLKMSKAQKEMKGLYKEAFVREPLANNFQNVIYEPENGFSENYVRDFQLCKMGNTFHSEDYIKASYKDIDFEVSQVCVRYVDNSDDNNYSKTYFDGRMMVFSFPEKLVSQVAVFSRKFKERSESIKKQKKDKVQLENVQFNKEFDVYSPVGEDAFYLITPHFMEHLQELCRKHQSVAMNVVGNKIVLAFNEPGNNAFDSSAAVGKLDYDKEMQKVQAEIDDIKNFISLVR